MRFLGYLGKKLDTFTANSKSLARTFFNSIALLGLFYTINADTIVQTGTGFWAPYTSFWRHFANEEKTLQEIVGHVPTNSTDTDSAESQKPVYVFVYDASASIKPTEDEIAWHKDAVDSLNGTMRRPDQAFEEKTDPSGTYLCKLKVAQLIQRLRGRDLSFSIWQVGNRENTGIVYPSRSKYTNSTEEHITDASFELAKMATENPDHNTDFVTLLKGLTEQYSELSHGAFNPFRHPSFVFIFVSDMIHDRENYLRQAYPNRIDAVRDAIHEDRLALQSHINQLSEFSALANVVMFSRPSARANVNVSEFKISLDRLFRSNFEYPRFNRLSLGDDFRNLLYPKIRARNSMNIYYSNPRYIHNESFYIAINHQGKYRLRLVNEAQGAAPSNFIMETQILQPNLQELSSGDSKGRLRTGGAFFDTPHLEPMQKIELTYNGRLPERKDISDLLVYLPAKTAAASGLSHMNSFLIPVDFVKRLPFGTVLFMITLQFVAGFSLLFLVVDLAREARESSNTPTKSQRKLPAGQRARPATDS